jgi:hypothetical protein
MVVGESLCIIKQAMEKIVRARNNISNDNGK